VREGGADIDGQLGGRGAVKTAKEDRRRTKHSKKHPAKYEEDTRRVGTKSPSYSNGVRENCPG